MELLSDYDIDIQYHPGKAKIVIVQGKMANLEVRPTILEDIRKAKEEDEYVIKAQKFDEEAKKGEFMVVSDGIVKFEGRVYVLETINLRE